MSSYSKEYLVGYSNDGTFQIIKALPENVIRPFATECSACLFADAPQGARASVACCSLIETAKANRPELFAFIRYLLDHIGDADTLEA